MSKDDDKEIDINGLEGYPYNPVTERFEGMGEEKRPWVKEFYRSMGYALFLARQENDTSLRQGYILLDNAVEQFLKSYLRNVAKTKFKRNRDYSFGDIVSMSKGAIKDSGDLLDLLPEYHDTRNKLYHSSVYLSVSKARFLDYLDNVFSLCKSIGFDDISDIVSSEYERVIEKVLDKKSDERYRSLKRIEDKVKDAFGLTPSHYQGDILLGSMSGDSTSALDAIKTLLFGIFGREDIKGKKARILEVVEANQENAFHTFLISHANSHQWYCFYNCFWSKWGEGKRRDVADIRKLIQDHKRLINYKKTHIKRGAFNKAFDPFFSDDRD